MCWPTAAFTHIYMTGVCAEGGEGGQGGGTYRAVVYQLRPLRCGRVALINSQGYEFRVR